MVGVRGDSSGHRASRREKSGSPHRECVALSRLSRRAPGRRLFAVTLYRDTGVVLRVQKLGEADRIVTLLTRRRGKVRAVAKGVRRTRSRWGARLEPFNHVDVQCYTGRSLDVVTQAQTVDAFGAGHRRRLPPLHRRLRGAGDRGPARRRGGRARAAGVPAGRRRDPGAGRPRARPVAGARRLPPARHDPRRLGPGDHATAPAAPRRARTGRSASRAGERCARGAARRARSRRRRETFGLLDALLHGDWTVPTPPPPRPAARPAGWWPRTCSGTWSASCARCRWWSGGPRRPARSASVSPASPRSSERP